MNFSLARTRMIDNQIRPSDITNRDLLLAFADVPRERFIPTGAQELAYIDADIDAGAEAAGDTRYVMSAANLARLIQLADVSDGDFVLDIGCGSGYSTAILAKLGSSVVALESDDALVQRATSTLIDLSIDNAAIVTGPLEEGCAAEGPYDVIFIGGSVEELPHELFDQLKEDGRLVVVEGQGSAAVARLYVKEISVVSGQTAFNCCVKPLPGFQKTQEFVF
ncbi:MAG: protein-L-isoaspartate O-methyltransferase [Pseudomonadota bacterium]